MIDCNIKEQDIMDQWNSDVNFPLVSICCATFNHREYIEEAIKSFLSQKTNFPFEIIVHDDSSTDGTDLVIREYEKRFPNIINATYQKKNQYSLGKKPFIDLLLPKAKGKYIAICEGDDYWIDNKKLHKQFQMLENNTEISLCIHASKVINEIDQSIELLRPYINNCYIDIKKIIENGGNYFATSSMFMRRIYFENIPQYIYNAPLGDYPISIFLASMGNVYYINEEMSIYRKFTNGSWTSRVLLDKKNHKEYVMKIVNMLFEIDAYYEYKYSKVIYKRIEKSYLSGLSGTNMYYDKRVQQIIKSQNSFKIFAMAFKNIIKKYLYRGKK
jgi:glycosyltransferase involved in cell wall biosynthesis